LGAENYGARENGRVFFRQVLYEDLGCASYVVADRGEAAVVDPKWGIEDSPSSWRTVPEATPPGCS
jgi:hypothetical protein